MTDIDSRLTAMLASRDASRDAKELFLDVAELIARDAAQELGRHEDEIGILMTGKDSTYLRFAAPRKLCDLGTIPLTKRDSIAVGVFVRRMAEAHNNVPLVRHVAFFESVRLAVKSEPIMKMVTVPILSGGQVIGVAEVSKKAETLAAAGADFGQADIHRAMEYFDSKARFLLAARPDRF